MLRTVHHMTTTDTPTAARDDLFTEIHKALRVALFDVTTAAGRTDWADPAERDALAARWHPVLALLRSHTAHEDDHIFRLLDRHDPLAVEPAGEQHADLDDLLEDLAERFEAALVAGDPARGLAVYRDLTRFVAAYLPHLHDEETRIMARIWECCSDDEIAATRAAFMADITPDVQATTIEYLLRAIDRSTRRTFLMGLAGAPAPVVDAVVAIAGRVLDHSDLADVIATIDGVRAGTVSAR